MFSFRLFGKCINAIYDPLVPTGGSFFAEHLPSLPFKKHIGWRDSPNG